MGSLQFDITGDNSHFINMMEEVRNSFKQTIDYIEKSGQDLGAVFKNLSSNGGISLGLEGVTAQVDTALKAFDKIVNALGASSEAAESAKKKFADAILEISNSTDDAATKQQRMSETLNNIFTEISSGASQVEVVSSALDTLNSTSSAASAATTINTTAHGAATVAVGAEAAAHGINSVSIGKETEEYKKQKSSIDDVVFSLQGLSKEDSQINAGDVEAITRRYTELKTEVEGLQQKLGTLQEGTKEYTETAKQLSDVREYLQRFGDVFLDIPSVDAVKEAVEAGRSVHQYTEEERKALASLREEQEKLTKVDWASSEQKNAEAEEKTTAAVEKTTNAIKEKGKVEEQANEKSKRGVKEIETELQNLQKQYNDYFGNNAFSRYFNEREYDSKFDKGLISEETNNEVNKLIDRINQLKEELKEAKKEAAEIAIGSEGGSDKARTINERLKEQRVAIEDTKAALAELEPKYDALFNKENLTARQRQELAQLGDEIKARKKEIDDANEAIRNIRGETTIGKIKNYFTSAGEGASQFRQDISKAASAIGDITVKAAEAIPGFKKVEEVLKGWGDNISEASSKFKNSGFAQGLSNGWNRFSAETKQATDAIMGFGSKVGNVITGNGKFQESLKDVGSAFNGMLGPVSAATAGIRQMTVAMMKMAMTPLGAVLAVIILGLKSMYDYLNKDADGQMKLAKITGYLGSIMASLGDIFVKVGKYLFHAFADAGAPMNAFAKSMITTFKTAVSTVVNLISGLGNTIKGVFTFDWDTFSKGLSQTWEAVKGAKDTVVNALDAAWKGVQGSLKIAQDGFNFLDGRDIMKDLETINGKAKEMAKLSAEQKQNEIAISEAKKNEALQDEKIAASREKIYTLSGKEKLLELEKLKNLQKEKFDARIAQYQKALDIQRETNNLHTTSLAAKEKERQLETQLLQVKAQQAAATRFTTRMEASTKRTMANEGKKADKKDAATAAAEAKLSELLYTQENDRIKAEQAMEKKIAEARVAAMKEGYEKTAAEQKLQFKNEIEAIEQQQAAAVEAERKKQKAVYDAEQAVVKAKGGKVKQWDNSMFNENDSAVQNIKSQYAELIKATREKQNADILKEYDNLVKAHQSYTDKKIAIDKKYHDDITAIDKAIADAEKNGQKETVDALKRARAEAEKERAKSQADLSLQQLKEMPEYIRAFEDLDNTSTETLEHLIQLFKDNMQAQAKSLNPEQMREWMNTIEQMEAKVNERNPWKALKKDTENLRKAHEKVKKAQDGVQKAQERYNAVLKKEKVFLKYSIDENGKAVKVYYDEKTALKELNDAKEKEREANDEEAQAQTKQKKSWEQARSEVDELANAIINLGNAIGGEAGQILNIIGSVMTFTTSVIDTIKSVTATGVAAMSTLEKASAILAIISAAFQVFNMISSLFGESEEEKQARLAREEMIRKMTSSVEQYRLAVIKARQEEDEWFATSAIRGLAQQWELSSEAQKSYFAIAKAQTKSLTEDIAGWGSAYYQRTDYKGRNSFYQAYHESLEKMGNDFDMLIKNEKDELETLSSFIKRIYGEDLFDEFGNLNTTAIDTFLADYSDRIQHDDEQILKNLNEMAKQYQEWQKELKNYINDQYGGFSDDIVDALWSWYEEGTDVMDAFKDSARETFQSIAKDMMKELVNSIVFDKLKDKLTEMYTAYSENVNKNKMSQQEALAILTSNIESALTEFEGGVSQELEMLQGVMTQIGEMSDRIFGDGTHGVLDYFDEIRSAWTDAVTRMGKDSADLGKEMARIMYENLIAENVFNKDFDIWLREWTKRYEEAVKTGNEAMKSDLEKEKADKIKKLTQATKEYADMAGYAADANDELSNSLSDLSDTLLDNLLDAEADAEDMGREIGQNLIREMLAELLASEKYAPQIENIKKLWQNVLKGGGKWTDEEGVFGEAGLEYDINSITEAIKNMNTEMANDEDIKSLIASFHDLDDLTDETSSSFGDLKSSFMDAITDMTNGTENFKKKLNDTLTKDLIEKNVFDVPITVTIGNEDKTFDNFKKYSEDWNKRYTDIYNNAELSAEERERLLQQLVDELVAQEAITAKAAEDLAKRLNKDTTFTSMTSSFVSALMNMDTDIKDFAQNMKKTIIQKLVESFMVSEQIKPYLDELQKTFDYIMNPKNDLSMEQRLEMMTKGFVDEVGNEYLGTDTVVEVMTPLNEFVNNLMTSAGFVSNSMKTLGDSLVSFLTSSGTSAEDFTDNLVKEISKDMVDAYVASEKLYERLAELKQKLADALASKDQAAIDAAKKDITDFVNETKKGLKDITSVFDELENDTTFSGMAESWASSLMDMSKTAEDWSKDIGQTMANRIIQQMIVPTMLQPLFDNLQKVFEGVMKANTSTDEEGNVSYDWKAVLNSDELKNEITKVTAGSVEAQKAIKMIMDAFGLDTSKYEGFSRLGDSILNSLASAEGDIKDWAADMGRQMAEQMAQAYIESKYQADIDKLNEAWQQALEEGNEDAIKNIESELENLYRMMGEDQRLQGFIDKFKEIPENPFEGLRDSFVSTLLDMESDAEDFANNIATTLLEKMVDKTIKDQFQTEIDKLEKDLANALAQGDTAMIDNLTQRIKELSEQMGEAVEPLLKAIKKVNKQTDTTFTSMRDSWISALMDMEGTAEEFAQNVGKTMAQKILAAMVAPKLIDPLLEKMQESFDKLLESGASYKTAIAAMSPYLDQIEDVYNQIIPIRDEIFTGFSIYQDTVEEAVEEVKYALQDMKSSFVSSLMDMESSTEDFSKNISQAMAQNFIENFVLGQKFDQQMEYWQRQYEGIISSGMSDTERKRQLKALRDTIASAKEGYVEEARAIQELLGLTTGHEDKTASVNVADKVTYDQMDEFTGILRAIQIAGEQRNDLIRDIRTQMGINTLVGATGDATTANAIMTTLSNMSQATSSGGSMEVKEIRNMMIYTNQYLLDIQKSNRSIYNDFGYKMDKIIDKLDDIG